MQPIYLQKDTNMKKIFTLVCAFALILSANAAQFEVASKKAPNPVFARSGMPTRALNMDLQAPARAHKVVAEEVDLTFTEVGCQYYSNAAYSQPGAYDYYFELTNGVDADGYYNYPYIMFDLYLPSNTGLVPGYYTMSAGDIANVYVILDYYDELYAQYGMEEYMSFVPVEVEMDLASAGTDLYNITMILTDADGDVINIELNAVSLPFSENRSDPNALPYDEQTNDFTGAYDLSSVSFDRSYLAEYGSIVVKATDGVTAALLDFNLIGGVEDPTIVIPAGTYTIDGTYNQGTVSASAGVQNGSIYASFVGTLTATGGFQTPLWFLEDGTVTVTNNNGSLSIVVAATNSYGRAINFTIGGGTALEDVEASSSVKKTLINGQLYIEKDGILYNALGATL